MVNTLNDLDNVLYEIANESAVTGSTQWQYDLSKFIKSYEVEKPHQHPVGMTSQAWSLAAKHDLLWNSPADWISLGQITGFDSAQDPYVKTPLAAPGGKVSVLDTDHLGWNIYINDAKLSRARVWKSFLRGHNPIPMENLKDHCGWIAARAAMGHTRTYANKMNLAAMTPRGELSTTGYCLAATGREYLVYLPDGGEVTVDLTATEGTLAVEWMHPVEGTISSGNPTAGGGKRQFKAPFTGDAVLYIAIKNSHP